MTDKEKSGLLQHVNKFCGHQPANSGKSGEPHLHREHPHIKSRSFLTNGFKNLKSTGVP
jgi:hypothetical protein